MNVRVIILFMALSLSTIILTSSFNIITNTDIDNTKVELSKLGSNDSNLSGPTPLRMYELISYYSDFYDIPKHIAFNVAYLETKYKGPFDWSYKHNLSSSGGALGPMQIMPTTANYVNKKRIDKELLKNDIELNIKTSMKLLSNLHKQYSNWNIVCGAYNTGKPIINSYARFCVSNKDYTNNWKRL
jgi:soluble lytic murein transglycosylase-like protein